MQWRGIARAMRCAARTMPLIYERFPDAVQRVSGAPQIRDRPTLGVRNGPGSAAHHFVLRCARETRLFPAALSRGGIKQGDSTLCTNAIK